MAIIRPFKALRPEKSVAASVSSVPYDVVNTQEARALSHEFPNSFLRITRSEVELPDSADPYSKEVYDLAKKNLAEITERAPLITEAEPHFYLYSLTMAGRTQTGIAATFAVDNYDNDVILKHEKTRKVKEDDRTNHITTTEAQTGVVFLTYKAPVGLVEKTDAYRLANTPEYDFTAPDGVHHQIWILPTEFNQIITEAVGSVEKLYIADGHHRAASASRARAAKQSANPNHTGDEEYNYFIAVLFPHIELHIMPYNRVVTDLNGHTIEGFISEVEKSFTVSVAGEDSPKEPQEFCMYLGGTWYTLTIKPELKENGKIKGAHSVGDTLDVSILQNYLLSPLLGIGDPRVDKRVDFIGGIRGTKELVQLVDSKKFAVAFSLYPVSLDSLISISDAGEIMPPKSTWFEPKLRDGLLTHLI